MNQPNSNCDALCGLLMRLIFGGIVGFCFFLLFQVIGAIGGFGIGLIIAAAILIGGTVFVIRLLRSVIGGVGVYTLCMIGVACFIYSKFGFTTDDPGLPLWIVWGFVAIHNISLVCKEIWRTIIAPSSMRSTG